MDKKLDGNYTRMLWAVLNKSRRQHPTKQQLYGYRPSIMKTIQVRWTIHVWHCWKSKDELISDILLWTPSHGRAKEAQPVRTYIQQVCANTGYSLEDLPGAMDDRDGWQERVREIRAGSVTWWWFKVISTVLNKSWKQHPTKQQVYGYVSPISQTILFRQIRCMGYCWWSKDKLISNVPLCTPIHGCASVGRPIRTYSCQLSEDTVCSLEDLLVVMEDRDDRESIWLWYMIRIIHD